MLAGIATRLGEALSGQTNWAEAIGNPWVWGIVVVVFVFLVLLIVILKRYQKVGPNEALIIYGAMTKGVPKVVRGGGTFVLPIIQKAEVLSLEVITIDVCTPEIFTEGGDPIVVDGTAQIKVHTTDEAIRAAAEQFLGRGPDKIMVEAKLILEGHLRAVLGQVKAEDVYENREMFALKVQETSAPDFAKMGLEVVSLRIAKIKTFGLRARRHEQDWLLGLPFQVPGYLACLTHSPRDGEARASISFKGPAPDAELLANVLRTTGTEVKPGEGKSGTAGVVAIRYFNFDTSVSMKARIREWVHELVGRCMVLHATHPIAEIEITLNC